MLTAQQAIWFSAQLALKAFGALYDVEVNGWGSVDKNKAAVFGVKHSSDVDFLLARHIFPEKAKIFATRKIFMPGVSYILHSAGFVPMTNASKSTRPNLTRTDYAAFREFYTLLEACKWVVYAPEAKCFPNSVGEKIFPEFIMKAAEMGIDNYLVGVRYSDGHTPWSSWMHGKRRIEVNIETYNASNKSKEQVKAEVRRTLERLSGLEQRISEEKTAATLSHQK